MRYTCTFLVFRLEKRQNIYCHLLKGIMFQYGIGFNIIVDQRKLVAERFLKALVIEYGKHPLSTDMVEHGTHKQACRFLNIEHHIHSLYERSNIERRTIQYIKDRTESFDDYFPCSRKGKCMLEHVRNWFNLFVDYHNKEVIA